MGIDYYFARIPSVDLIQLRHYQTREVIKHLFQRTDMELVISPRDESESFDTVRHIAMDMSFWSLVRDLIAPPDDAPLLWKLQESETPQPDTTIGDVWMGYSSLYFMTPEQVKQSSTMLTEITPAILRERYVHEFAHDDDMDDEEKESLYLTILVCFNDVSNLLKQAMAYDEAFVWYIG